MTTSRGGGAQRKMRQTETQFQSAHSHYAAKGAVNDPEARLAKKIILLAIQEATRRQTKFKNQNDSHEMTMRRRDAISWIRQNGAAFRFWCSLAQINPEQIGKLLEAT